MKEKHNPFFQRKELEILLIHPNSPTPSKESIKNLLKENYKVEDSQIEINYVISKIGSPESIAKVRIYEVVKSETQPSQSKQDSKQ